MAEFLVRNPLNPSKAVSFGITYRQIVDVNDRTRELIWVLEIATDETTVSGLAISPEIIHLTSLDNMDEVIRGAVERISAKIDWEPLSDDTRAPIVDEVSPSTYFASIYDNVKFKLIDLDPSAGIDLENIQVFINDIEVSPDLIINGDEYGCEVEWRPTIRVFDTY
jgi:hypothetical protein